MEQEQMQYRESRTLVVSSFWQLAMAGWLYWTSELSVFAVFLGFVFNLLNIVILELKVLNFPMKDWMDLPNDNGLLEPLNFIDMTSEANLEHYCDIVSMRVILIF